MTGHMLRILLLVTLYDPVPPPGFRLDPFDWEPERGWFTARETWLALVDLASLTAQYNKNDLLDHWQKVNLVVSGSIIVFVPYDEPIIMTYGEVVWGLVDIGSLIARQYPFPRMVPRFSGEMQSRGRNPGFFQSVPSRRQAATASSNETDILPVSASRRRDLTSNEGSVTCADDPNLVIHYQFLGQALNPGEVLTAFLSAQTFFSEHPGQQRGANLLARGLGHHVQLRIESVEGLLTWDEGRIGVRTLWREVIVGYNLARKAWVPGPNWEAVSFRYEYRGVTLGWGLLGL
ncbi:MAG: hypothetical protein Q9218_006632 [Villophora microphyllina]